MSNLDDILTSDLIAEIYNRHPLLLICRTDFQGEISFGIRGDIIQLLGLVERIKFLINSGQITPRDETLGN